MAGFGIRFLVCNVFIAVLIGILLAVKRLLKGSLSGRFQYNLWFLLIALLAVPFMPFRPAGITRLSALLDGLHRSSGSFAPAADTIAPSAHSGGLNWLNDFSVSVSREASSAPGLLFMIIWIAGMMIMLTLFIKSQTDLYKLKKTALPLQSPEIRTLFEKCRQKLNISREIHLYSTAFLYSPVTAGFFRPCIYIPLHVISDFQNEDISYMLLHELQHYRHMDALINPLVNLARIVYWFNPFVLYALREMVNDREIACDSSVLKLLDKKEYEAYGSTLIRFAEKISRPRFSLTAGIGGSVKQMKKRIMNIASYRPDAKGRLGKGWCIYVLTALLLFEASALLPSYARNAEVKTPAVSDSSAANLSPFFRGYNGCFVMYDLGSDSREIYNRKMALKRVSPNSTYKIYSGLLALELGTITPEASSLKWDGREYPFSQWNRDQNLKSAMQNSVNWYFRTLDRKAGSKSVDRLLKKIGYGNQDMSGGLPDFWLESTLKISPLEQVDLLKKLFTNEFNFRKQNIDALKSAMYLGSSESGSLYGKTGTGAVNGEEVNGWFVGFIETEDNTYFFAVNIQGKTGAGGKKAGEIALEILKSRKLYEP